MLLAAAACQAEELVQPEQPAPVVLDKSEFGLLGFGPIESLVLYGTEVDSSPRYQWNAELHSELDEWFPIFSSAVAESLGYRVIDEESYLFGTEANEDAEFLIQGRCHGVEIRNSDGRPKADITIEWQVFDIVRREVVFSRVTAGSGPVFRDDYAETFHQAISNALLKFLAHPKFQTYQVGG